MDWIYTTTSHGRIWLGEDSGIASQARDTIAVIVDEAYKEINGFSQLTETVYDASAIQRYSSSGLSIY
ncbi:hypothetical protein LTR53_010012, partial [Teratosphaeriaceae sp. CCFEE 6253]